jgi:hypothetical protein
MVMGDTATTPDQWLTAGNLTIFQGGSELRRAAASARRVLVDRAAQRLGAPVGDLIVEDGVVRLKTNPRRAVAYSELLGSGLQLKVDPKIELRKSAQYKVIGKSIPRVDIPAKVTGEFEYVHDVRLPGMLHARVVRPDDLGAGPGALAAEIEKIGPLGQHPLRRLQGRRHAVQPAAVTEGIGGEIEHPHHQGAVMAVARVRGGCDSVRQGSSLRPRPAPGSWRCGRS